MTRLAAAVAALALLSSGCTGTHPPEDTRPTAVPQAPPPPAPEAYPLDQGADLRIEVGICELLAAELDKADARRLPERRARYERWIETSGCRPEL